MTDQEKISDSTQSRYRVEISDCGVNKFCVLNDSKNMQIYVGVGLCIDIWTVTRHHYPMETVMIVDDIRRDFPRFEYPVSLTHAWY